MSRTGLGVLVLALAACQSEPAPPIPWLYEAPLPLTPRAPSTGAFGRGEQPLSLAGAGIVAGAGVTGGPLAILSVVSSGGRSGVSPDVGSGAATTGPAELLVYGSIGTEHFVELIAVDAGVVRWRTATGAAVLHALTASTAVVGSDERIVGLERASGAMRWQVAAEFRAHAGELIVGAVRGAVVFIDARTGTVTSTLTAPAGEASVIAACASPAYALAWGAGQLSRWEPASPTTLRASWSVPMPQPSRIDACGSTVLVASGGAVLALDPATGTVVGGPVTASDFWSARAGDGVELAVSDGIEARDRRLSSSRRLESVLVDRLLAARGSRRVVAQADQSLVLLDEHGARGLTDGFGAEHLALGDHYFMAGSWAPPVLTEAARPTRWALPSAGKAMPSEPLVAPVLGDPPRMDIPEPRSLPNGVAYGGVAAAVVHEASVDPDDPERVYVRFSPMLTGEGGGLAAFDLHRDLWRWHAPDACPPGRVAALAIASETIVCGAYASGSGLVRAVRKQDGAPAWEWRGEAVDAIHAAGGASGAADIVVISVGARVVVLDGATGVERVSWRTSDGYAPRIALVQRGNDTIVASYEHARVVMRSARLGLRPWAALDARGTVAALHAVGDRVAVELTDGTLYFLDDRGGAVAAGAWFRGWRPRGDLAIATSVEGEGAGLVVGFGSDGVADVFWGLDDAGIVTFGGRGLALGAPLALISSALARAIVVRSDGTPVAAYELPVGALAESIVTTLVHDQPVTGLLLAQPLRFVRLE